MKRWALTAATLILALLLGACGGSSTPTASTELNLYAWSEYVPQTLIDGFTQETGIKVNYDTYASNEELLAKLQAGASGYDVIIPSDYAITIMINQGQLEELDHTRLPNLTNLGEPFRNLDFDPGNRYSLPYQWGTAGMVVDTGKVTRPVTRWEDLWSPEFEGRVVLPDDSREVLGIALRTLGYDVNTTEPTQLEQAKNRVMELLPNVKLFDSDSPKTALLSGEVWLGQVWNGEAALAHQENPAIEYFCPEEGCTIWYDNLAIPKNAPHPDAAHAFLNYVLRPEVSLLITREFPYSSPNTAAIELLQKEDPAAYDAYMSFAATNPPADMLGRTSPIRDVGEATSLYDRLWTEIKGGE